uniref:Homing endonuclease LAGLIDADG domain-containing protein n=1 Tax=Placozoan sp. 'Shirahama' TaxID=702324 RepID=D6RUS7_9METZ|nr:hypothetical protein PlspshoM_p15 [Placozoan sp. 'Shirahama']BAJ09644.1 hypothetical protein [Placozoan sp. 'Shirahama']
MKKTKQGGAVYDASPPYENKGVLLAPFSYHLTQYYKQIGTPNKKSIGSRLFGLISFGGPREPFGLPPHPSFFSSWVVGLMEGAGVFKISGAKKGIWRERDPEGLPGGESPKGSPLLPTHLQIPNSYFFIQWLLFSSSYLAQQKAAPLAPGPKYKMAAPTAGSEGSHAWMHSLGFPPLIEFELILGPKEGATGHFLRKKLGFGSITFDRKGSVRYHVTNKTHLRNLVSFMMEKGALGINERDGSGAQSAPPKILELGLPPLLSNAKGSNKIGPDPQDPRTRAPKAPPLLGHFVGPGRLRRRSFFRNFNLDAWLSGFFETTCSFQIFHKRFKRSREGGNSPLSTSPLRFGSGRGRLRRPRAFNFSVGIGACPNSTPPFTNPNWRDPWDPEFNISVGHDNETALLILKSYFGGHIVKTDYLPFLLNIKKELPSEPFGLPSPPFLQNSTSLMSLQRKKSFIYILSNKNFLIKLIKILGRDKLKTKKRIEFLKWSKIFFASMERKITSTPLTNRNKKRIKDFLLFKRDS